jgi:hypothetical protein
MWIRTRVSFSRHRLTRNDPTVDPGTYGIPRVVEPKDPTAVPFFTISIDLLEFPLSHTPDPSHYDAPKSPSRAVGSTMHSHTLRQSYSINYESPAPDLHAHIRDWSSLNHPAGNRTSMKSRAPRPILPARPPGDATPADHNIHLPMDRGSLLGRGRTISPDRRRKVCRRPLSHHKSRVNFFRRTPAYLIGPVWGIRIGSVHLLVPHLELE